MRNLLPALLLTSSALFAQQAPDLAVTLSNVPARVEPGTSIPFGATVENIGDAVAKDVRFVVELFPGGVCEDTSESVFALAPGERRSVSCSVNPGPVYFATAVAFAYDGEQLDRNETNNTATRDVEINTPPDLLLFLYSGPPNDPGLPFPIALTYFNAARTTATGVVVELDFGETTVTKLPPNCTAAGARITCDVGTVAPAAPASPLVPLLNFEAVAPDVSEGTVTVRATIGLAGADANPENNDSEATYTNFRTFFVTSTADEGSGSLRAGIEAANAACADDVPCKVAVRIPPADGIRWHTIRPATPLPAVLADGVAVDGATQTRYFGETNADGPEVELSGTLAPAGANGIVIASPCGSSVAGFTINAFGGDGVRVSGEPCGSFAAFRAVGGSYIGTDPTGTIAVPNGRGIVVDRPEAYRTTDIVGNLISGNTRSGIFIANGGPANIRGNIIGLNAKLTAGLGNGASGVYIGDGGDGSDVRDNYIGFNRHFGIGVHTDAESVSMEQNSFQANHQLAIDHGLDGVSLVIGDDNGGNPGPLHAPVITSAVYDAASDKTIIRGVGGPHEGFSSEWATIYANDAADPLGYGEGQYVLGRAQIENRQFRFVHPGRTPGPFVSATTTRYTIWGFLHAPRPDAGSGGYSTTTSEFGPAVPVQ